MITKSIFEKKFFCKKNDLYVVKIGDNSDKVICLYTKHHVDMVNQSGYIKKFGKKY